MSETVEKIMVKSDDELRFWTLSGQPNSYVHQIGQTEMNMRCAMRIAKAAEEMATANGNLVQATTDMARANRLLVEATNQVVQGHHGLIRETRNLVRATWGIVLITLITQIALIVSEVLKR
jgi:hypothetical protein